MSEQLEPEYREKSKSAVRAGSTRCSPLTFTHDRQCWLHSPLSLQFSDPTFLGLFTLTHLHYASHPKRLLQDRRLFLHMELMKPGGRTGRGRAAHVDRGRGRPESSRAGGLDKLPGPHVLRFFLHPEPFPGRWHGGSRTARQLLLRERVELFDAHDGDTRLQSASAAFGKQIVVDLPAAQQHAASGRWAAEDRRALPGSDR